MLTEPTETNHLSFTIWIPDSKKSRQGSEWIWIPKREILYPDSFISSKALFVVQNKQKFRKPTKKKIL